MKKLTCFFVALLIFYCINNCYSQDIDSLYTLNPVGFVAQKICDKRIVMFGEGIQHDHPVSNFCFTGILNTWLDLVSASDTSNNNLAIIFEMDSATASRLKHYIYTGDIRPLMDFAGIEHTFEKLESYYLLKKFKQRIDSVNIKRKHKLNLDIRGFEQIGYNDDDEYFKMNQKENELWFINIRDKYTSEGAINYLKKNPEFKALFFYGGAHLREGYVNKRSWPMGIPDEDCMGYWLAQYLEDAFRKENVERIIAMPLPRNDYNDSSISSLIGKSFLFLKPFDKLTWLKPDSTVYPLILPQKLLTIHRIQNVLNRFVIEKSIKQIAKYEKLIPGYKANGRVSFPLYALKFLLGTDFQKAVDIKKWYNKKRFNAVKYIDSREFQDNIMKYYLQYLPSQRWDDFLTVIGFTNDYNDSTLSLTSRAWFDKNWDEALKNIKIINSIGTLWAGYPDEKKEAREFLKIVSGKDFGEPAEYLLWWRKEYKKLGI